MTTRTTTTIYPSRASIQTGPIIRAQSKGFEYASTPSNSISLRFFSDIIGSLVKVDFRNNISEGDTFILRSWNNYLVPTGGNFSNGDIGLDDNKTFTFQELNPFIINGVSLISGQKNYFNFEYREYGVKLPEIIDNVQNACILATYNALTGIEFDLPSSPSVGDTITCTSVVKTPCVCYFKNKQLGNGRFVALGNNYNLNWYGRVSLYYDPHVRPLASLTLRWSRLGGWSKQETRHTYTEPATAGNYSLLQGSFLL